MEIKDDEKIVADDYEQELLRLLANLKRTDSAEAETKQQNEKGLKYLSAVSETAKTQAEDEKREAFSLATAQKRAREKAVSSDYGKCLKTLVEKKNEDEETTARYYDDMRQDELSKCAQKVSLLERDLETYLLKEKKDKQSLLALLKADETKEERERALAEEVHVKNSASRSSRQASEREILTVEFAQAYDNAEQRQLQIYRERLTSLRNALAALKAEEEGRRESVTRGINNRLELDQSDLNVIYSLLDDGKSSFQEVENFAKYFGSNEQLRDPTSVGINSMREARNQFEVLHSSLGKGRDRLPWLIAEYDAEFKKVALYAVGSALGILAIVGLLIAWQLGAF